MDMTIDEFYKQLSNVYETGSPEAVELYLNKVYPLSRTL